MISQEQTTKVFLLGSIILGVLIVGGLVWAIASGSDNGGSGSTVTFNDTNDPVIGSMSTATAVTVRVYGDLQCPACREAEAGFEYARQTYGDRVRFVWNDFPLQTVHPNAMVAAQAARCAEAQGKFWEYHDRLYADQSSWADLSNPRQKFIDYAGALGMKQDDFASCYDAKMYQSKITDDITEGTQNRVEATPTFFINTVKVEGSMSNADWDKYIQAALAGK